MTVKALNVNKYKLDEFYKIPPTIEIRSFVSQTAMSPKIADFQTNHAFGSKSCNEI